jgi:RNA polymerase sigma-70 factor (ECF subfamily)
VPWLAVLSGLAREQALALHDLLLRVARAELNRRAGRHPITGPELDDLAHQAADVALLAITAKLGRCRRESRFTTWACKFVVLEVSSKLGRRFWQLPAVALDAADWDQLPDRFGISLADHAEREDLVTALRTAIAEELTDRQRQVFTAIAVQGVPLDALVAQMGSSRNAICKTMFDARRKLRVALAADGYLTSPARATILSEGGLVPALKTLARRSIVPVELDVQAVARLPEPVEVAAYYVISEALANAAKLSNASVVRIGADIAGNVLHLHLRVLDDGDGGANRALGSGLVGLKDRVEALGGTISPSISAPAQVRAWMLICRWPPDRKRCPGVPASCNAQRGLSWNPEGLGFAVLVVDDNRSFAGAAPATRAAGRARRWPGLHFRGGCGARR